MSYIVKPKRCPNCGQKLSSMVGIVNTRGFPAKSFMAISDLHFVHGFDCYCKHCKWSGDIYPDTHEIISFEPNPKNSTSRTLGKVRQYSFEE